MILYSLQLIFFTIATITKWKSFFEVQPHRQKKMQKFFQSLQENKFCQIWRREIFWPQNTQLTNFYVAQFMSVGLTSSLNDVWNVLTAAVKPL